MEALSISLHDGLTVALATFFAYWCWHVVNNPPLATPKANAKNVKVVTLANESKYSNPSSLSFVQP